MMCKNQQYSDWAHYSPPREGVLPDPPHPQTAVCPPDSPLCPLRPLLLLLIEQLINLLALVVLLIPARLLLRLLRGRLDFLRAILIEVLRYYDTNAPHSPRVETRLHEGLATALEHIGVVIVLLKHQLVLAGLHDGLSPAHDRPHRSSWLGPHALRGALLACE